MYEKELEVAINAAKSAGKAIMNFFNTKGGEVELKDDKTLLTKADLESNKIILEELKGNFPNDGIISEELDEVSGERKWYVDPLDGTESFVRRSDEFGIHIGLCEGSSPVLGVVYRPANSDLYYAAKGQGAFKITSDNTKTQLKLSPTKTEDMTAIIGYGNKQLENINKFLELLKTKDVIRRASTGLKILGITDHEADVFILSSPNFRSWDICAPQAILEEAGGHLSYADNTPLVYPTLNPEKVIYFTKSKEQLSYSLEKTKHLFQDN